MTAPWPTLSDIASPRRGSVKLWAFAALGAVLLHAGGAALAIGYMQPAEDDDALGAPALEIAYDLAAPRLDPTDLPPGPEADESTASPAVVEQKQNVEKTDLPKDTPTETDDPDRVVAPDASKKPKDDDPKIVETEAQPSTESTASEATAPPTSETAKEAPKSTAPAQGIGDAAQRVRTTWQKQLVAHLDHFKRYPSGDQRRSVQVVLQFTLDRLGHVVSANVVQGSGDPAFDEAARAMMQRADPVPPPPPLVADEGLTFTLPVVFRVKGHG